MLQALAGSQQLCDLLHGHRRVIRRTSQLICYYFTKAVLRAHPNGECDPREYKTGSREFKSHLCSKLTVAIVHLTALEQTVTILVLLECMIRKIDGMDCCPRS